MGTLSTNTSGYYEYMDAYVDFCKSQLPLDFEDFPRGDGVEEAQDLIINLASYHTAADVNYLSYLKDEREVTPLMLEESDDAGMYPDSEGCQVSKPKKTVYHELASNFTAAYQKASGMYTSVKNTSSKVSNLFFIVQDLFVSISEKTNATVARVLAVAVSVILFQLMMTLMAIAVKVVLFAAFVFVVTEFLIGGINPINPRTGIDYVEGLKLANS